MLSYFANRKRRADAIAFLDRMKAINPVFAGAPESEELVARVWNSAPIRIAGQTYPDPKHTTVAFEAVCEGLRHYLDNPAKSDALVDLACLMRDSMAAAHAKNPSSNSVTDDTSFTMSEDMLRHSTALAERLKRKS